MSIDLLKDEEFIKAIYYVFNYWKVLKDIKRKIQG